MYENMFCSRNLFMFYEQKSFDIIVQFLVSKEYFKVRFAAGPSWKNWGGPVPFLCMQCVTEAMM